MSVMAPWRLECPWCDWRVTVSARGARGRDQGAGYEAAMLGKEHAETHGETLTALLAGCPPPESSQGMSACCVCGSSDDLRVAPLMTGDKFGQPPQHPVCGPCFRAWYESGETTQEGILGVRGLSAAVPESSDGR